MESGFNHRKVQLVLVGIIILAGFVFYSVLDITRRPVMSLEEDLQRGVVGGESNSLL